MNASRLLSLAPLGLVAALLVGPGAPGAEPTALIPPPAGDEEVDIARCMDALKVNLKTVAAGLSGDDDSVDGDTLKALAAMQVWSLRAKALSPPMDDVAADKRGAHGKAYRADMARLLAELCQMEIEILEGDRAGARARVRGGLFELRDSAHEKFQTY